MGTGNTETLHQHAGGWEALYRLSDIFYHLCLKDPILQPFFWARTGFNITEEQRQRFVDLYLLAADQAGLPDDKPFRKALRSHVDFGSHVAKQNSNAKSDAELHPLREVPKWTWPEDE